MSLLTQLIQQHAPNTVKLVGSSLGGWYATVLAERYAVRSILINPAVRPHRLLSAAVGEHINYSTGERYQFTTTHVKELVDLDLTTLQHPERIKVFVETGDELLDYHEALTFYRDTHPVVIQGGNHGFVSFITHIPEIMAF